MTTTSMTPQEFYAQCEDDERRLITPAKRRKLITKIYLSTPVFVANELDKAIFESDSDDVKLGKYVRRGVKYELLLRDLRGMKEPHEVRVLLARWGLQEGAFKEPEEIFPDDFEKVARKLFKGMRQKDLHHVQLVLIWLPYFDRLGSDYKRLGRVRRLKDELIKIGYDAKAIDEVLEHPKSSLEAMAPWLEDRKLGPTESFRNAFSAFKAQIRRYSREQLTAFNPEELDMLKRFGII